MINNKRKITLLSMLFNKKIAISQMEIFSKYIGKRNEKQNSRKQKEEKR
jgi:hypothetical protein